MAQEANVVGKRALIHLLYTRSLKNFNWSQVQRLKSAIKTCVYFVYNLVSWKPPHTVSASALQSMDSGRSGVPGASARRPARMGPSRGAGYALQPHTGAQSAGGPGQRADPPCLPPSGINSRNAGAAGGLQGQGPLHQQQVCRRAAPLHWPLGRLSVHHLEVKGTPA